MIGFVSFVLLIKETWKALVYFLRWDGFLEVHFSLAFLTVEKLNLLFGLFFEFLARISYIYC